MPMATPLWTKRRIITLHRRRQNSPLPQKLLEKMRLIKHNRPLHPSRRVRLQLRALHLPRLQPLPTDMLRDFACKSTPVLPIVLRAMRHCKWKKTFAAAFRKSPPTFISSLRDGSVAWGILCAEKTLRTLHVSSAPHDSQAKRQLSLARSSFVSTPPFRSKYFALLSALS